MIGKPHWFVRRKYGGWGLFPVAWQGWVYLIAFIAAIFATQYISGDQTTKMVGLGVVGIILVLDTIDIMIRMKSDERETIHEAFAERNALWTIVFVLAAGVAYQAAQSAVLFKVFTVDPVIIIALIAGLAVKAASNYYLDKKD